MNRTKLFFYHAHGACRAQCFTNSSLLLCGEVKRQRRLAPQKIRTAKVVCGTHHTLALTREGRVYSTGKSDSGRLGRQGRSRQAEQDQPEFEEIEYFTQNTDSVLQPGLIADIIKVGAGDNFSAALSSTGELWVWGQNDYGQMGLGEEAMQNSSSAERYPRLVRTLPMEGHAASLGRW